MNYKTQKGDFEQICANAGNEFMSKELKSWCVKNNVMIDNSPLEGQNSNGFNERHYRMIQKMARGMLVHARL